MCQVMCDSDNELLTFENHCVLYHCWWWWVATFRQEESRQCCQKAPRECRRWGHCGSRSHYFRFVFPMLKVQVSNDFNWNPFSRCQDIEVKKQTMSCTWFDFWLFGLLQITFFFLEPNLRVPVLWGSLTGWEQRKVSAVLLQNKWKIIFKATFIPNKIPIWIKLPSFFPLLIIQKGLIE